MTLQQLRYFITLCEERNFTRAAKRCGVTQPSLTRAVKQLEAEFGGPLFERHRKASELSDLGRLVQPYLVQIDLSATEAKRKAADFLAVHCVGSIQKTERPMRKAAYGAAAMAVVALMIALIGHLTKSATASPPLQTTKIVTPYELESTIDVKKLPRLDVERVLIDHGDE
jgi:hypothetical protein